MSIEARLAELGIALPEPAAPVAAYVPVVIAGGLAHVSGQLPFIGGSLVTGRLGEDVSLEDGTDDLGWRRDGHVEPDCLRGCLRQRDRLLASRHDRSAG